MNNRSGKCRVRSGGVSPDPRRVDADVSGNDSLRRYRAMSRTTEPVTHDLVRRLVLYDSYMSELPVSEARERLADVIDRARTGEPVYVTRRGRRVAVIVDADAYDALVEAAEDAVDRAELRAARVEDDYVP